MTVALALLMQSLDVAIVATALDALTGQLHTSVSWAGWTITVYSIGMVLALPLSARLSDRFGRRRLFVASVAAFAVASLCCGLAANIYELIALRALQAIGGAGLTPSATAIVVEHFGRARDRAIGLFGSVFRIGAITGPILGGLFVAYLSWRWIFFVNVPISAALILASLKLVPADPKATPKARTALDLRGVSLLGAGILAAMIGTTLIGNAGVRPRVVGGISLAVAVVLLWWFMRHVVRVPDPLVAPRLIRGAGFGAMNVINVLYGGATVGVMSLVPLYAIKRYQMDALSAGTVLTAYAVAGAIVSIAAAFGLRRTGYRMPLYVGAVLGAAGLVALGIGPQDGVSAYAWLAGASALVGIGINGADPAARNAGLQLMPEQSGSIAALRTMGRRIGTGVSVPVVTAIMTSSSSPTVALASSLAGFGVLLLVAMPVISRVPEHRGSW